VQSAMRKLAMVDDGLERPFMSLVGYTTPSTFDGVMDGETATQGLVGRAIVVNEPDINPLPRKGFKKVEMPMTMDMRLKSLTGREMGQIGPVEHYGDRRQVQTDPDAAAALSDILDWLIAYADDANETTGEASVAIVRRSFEMVAKISFIMGIGDDRRTLEHVRWAFAYVKAELDAKVALVFANDNAKERPEEALAARILGRLDPEKGMTANVLANRLKASSVKIDEILGKLETAGDVRRIILNRTHRGSKIVHWFPIE
jgi:hypothetical protein